MKSAGTVARNILNELLHASWINKSEHVCEMEVGTLEKLFIIISICQFQSKR